MESAKRPTVATAGFVMGLSTGPLLACTLASFCLRPVGEFSSLPQFVLFELLITGGSLLIFGGVGFALASAPFWVGRITIPRPVFVGVLAGIAVMLLGGVGGRFGRRTGVPPPISGGLGGFRRVRALPFGHLASSHENPIGDRGGTMPAYAIRVRRGGVVGESGVFMEPRSCRKTGPVRIPRRRVPA